MKANYKVVNNRQAQLKKVIQNFEPTGVCAFLMFRYYVMQLMLYGWNISNVRKLSLPMHQLHLKRAPQSWQYINLNADDIESVAAAIE